MPGSALCTRRRRSGAGSALPIRMRSCGRTRAARGVGVMGDPVDLLFDGGPRGARNLPYALNGSLRTRLAAQASSASAMAVSI